MNILSNALYDSMKEIGFMALCSFSEEVVVMTFLLVALSLFGGQCGDNLY